MTASPTDEIDEQDPFEAEEYQRFVADCASQCRCTRGVCDGVLAGGPCDGIVDDEDWRDGLENEE